MRLGRVTGADDAEVTDAGLDAVAWRLDHAVLRNAQLTPDKPALIFEDDSLSYAALARLVM